MKVEVELEYRAVHSDEELEISEKPEKDLSLSLKVLYPVSRNRKISSDYSMPCLVKARIFHRNSKLPNYFIVETIIFITNKINIDTTVIIH